VRRALSGAIVRKLAAYCWEIATCPTTAPTHAHTNHPQQAHQLTLNPDNPSQLARRPEASRLAHTTPRLVAFTRPRASALDFRQRTCDEQRSWGAQPPNMSMTERREPRRTPGRRVNRNHTRSLGGVRLLAGLSGLRRSGWLSGIRLRVGRAGARRLAGLSGLRHASGLSGIGCLGGHLGSLLVGMSGAVNTCPTRRARRALNQLRLQVRTGFSSAPRATNHTMASTHAP
jgi:hypothetical protein